MAVVKTEYQKISVSDQGETAVETRTLYADDGVIVGDQFNNEVIKEGDDITTQSAWVQAMLPGIWTTQNSI